MTSMTQSTPPETLTLTSEKCTATISEHTRDNESWLCLDTDDGHHILTLNDEDCSNLINALTNVWRARIATNIDALKEGHNA